MIKSIINRLLDVEYGTDTQMRPVQKYNLPHFVDLNLSYFQTWYETINDESLISENRYCFTNLYTPNDNNNDMEFPKTYMSNILSGSSWVRKKITPFLLFRKTINNTYRAISVNKISVELKMHSHPMLYVESRDIIPCEDLLCLLLPFKTNYREYGNGTAEWDGLEGITFNISENGKIIFQDQHEEIYESIQLLPNTIKLYFGSIESEDIAIKIKDDNLKFGEKIYIDSILLFNTFGELVYDTHKYFDEFENNIFTIKNNINIVGWRYYVFYYTEADISVNNIYSYPQYIIDHDTEAKILKTGSYILGEEEFNKIIDETNGLNNDDLRLALSKNPSLENYDKFLNKWLERVFKYKHNLVQDLLDENYEFIKHDATFYSITRKLHDYIPDENGIITIKRKIWRLYGEDPYYEYGGYCDVLLFINGFLDLTCVNYEDEDSEFTIDTDFINIEKYGENPTLEIVFISNVRNKYTSVVIGIDQSTIHLLRADKYYEPRFSNFYHEELAPLYTMRDMDNKPTLQQALPYTYKKVDHKLYDITFNENWIKLTKMGEAISCGLLQYDDISKIVYFYNDDSKIMMFDLNTILEKIDNKEDVEKYLLENTPISYDVTSLLESVKNSITFTAEDGNYGVVILSNLYYDRVLTVNNDHFNLYETYIGDIVDMCNDYKSDLFYMLSSDFDIYTFKAHTYNDIELIDKSPIMILDATHISFDTYYDEISLDYGDMVSGIRIDNKLLLLEMTYADINISPLLHIYELNEDGTRVIRNITEQFIYDLPLGKYKFLIGDDTLYIIGGTSYTDEGKIYIYDYKANKLTFITDIPSEYIGIEGNNILYQNGKIYIIGGVSGKLLFNTKISYIGVYDININTWNIYNLNMIFYDAIMCDIGDKIALIGGYNHLVKDKDDYKMETYILDKNKLEDQNYLDKLVPFKTDINYPVSEGIAIQDVKDSNIFYIIGSDVLTLQEYIYNFSVKTGNISKSYEMPLEFNHCEIVDMSSNEFNNLLLVGYRLNGYNYDRTLKITGHKYPNCIFMDTYNKLYVTCGDTAYCKIDKNTWAPSVDLSFINDISPIKRITNSEDIIVAVLENGIVVTTPDLDRWYTYDDIKFGYHNDGKFYYDKEFKDRMWEDKNTKYVDNDTGKVYKFINKDSIALEEYKEINNMDMIPTLYSSIFITYDGNIYYNPYNMNLSKIYNRNIVISSKNRFASHVEEVEAKWDYITLNDKFKYCNDISHYAVFKNGVLLEKDKYKIVLPEVNNPVNGIYMYFKIGNDDGDIYSIIYLPFNTDIVHRNELKDNGLITIKNTDIFNRYGIGKNFYWLFTNGRKIPYSYLKDISNNIIQITNIDSLQLFNEIEIMQLADIYNTSPFDIDEFNANMDTLIDNLIDWGYDEILISDLANIVNSDIPIEEKVVLLRIYADHYAINADKLGHTAPFILDDEYKNYPILDARDKK